MVSRTGKTTAVRAARTKNQGRKRKRLMTKRGTPTFPIQPEGYDPKAADAKPTADPSSKKD